MKNAILLHGAGDSPHSYWFPYLRTELKARGYDVWVPKLPHPGNPVLEEQLPFVLKNGTFTEETVIIGHSAGCPLILAVLEQLSVQVQSLRDEVTHLRDRVEKILDANRNGK